MNIKLLSTVAVAAALGFSAAAFAQADQPNVAADAPVPTSVRMGLRADGAPMGVGAQMSAVALSDVSGLESWLIGSKVTNEAGEGLATIKDAEYSDAGVLTQFIVEDDAGLRYGLPAEDVMLHTTIVAVTTTKTIAELAPNRDALGRLGDAIEDAVDGDEAPEDRGADHSADGNDVDDPATN